MCVVLSGMKTLTKLKYENIINFSLIRNYCDLKISVLNKQTKHN